MNSHMTMTATKTETETFDELLSFLKQDPFWKLMLSQIPSHIFEKEDKTLLMKASWKTPAHRFRDELMSCVEEVIWNREDLSFSEIGVVLEDFLRGYKESHECKEEQGV